MKLLFSLCIPPPHSQRQSNPQFIPIIQYQSKVCTQSARGANFYVKSVSVHQGCVSRGAVGRSENLEGVSTKYSDPKSFEGELRFWFYSDQNIRMRNEVLCTESIRPNQSHLAIFCIFTIWPGGPRSPVRIIAQVQWFMYQNRLEPSNGI
jgi:hypothetical protein